MTEENEEKTISVEQQKAIFAEVGAILKEMGSSLPDDLRDSMNDLMHFRASLSSETDRGSVLMAAAYLDDRLKMLLQKVLVQDKKISKEAFEFNGPLGTFSSRINFAYLLGVLPKNARLDLHNIRNIRNIFAHQAAPLTFEEPKVKSLCGQLTFHGVKSVASPDSKFRRSVMALLTSIINAEFSVKSISAAADFPIPDRTDAYKTVSEIFTKVTGKDYPLKNHHE